MHKNSGRAQRWGQVLGAIVAVTATSITLRAAAQSQERPLLPRGVILTETDAYVLLPPDVVAGPQVLGVAPSSRGDYVLVRRLVLPPVRDLFNSEQTPKRAELSLILWNVTTRQATVVWKRITQPNEAIGFPTVEWLPGTAVALLQEVSAAAPDDKEIKHRLLLLDAVQGTTRVVSSQYSPTSVLIVARQPIAALYVPETRTVRLLGPNGFMGSPRTLGSDVPDFVWMRWREPGKTLAFDYRLPLVEKGQKASWYRGVLDMATGKVTEETQEEAQAAQRALQASAKTDVLPGTELPVRLKRGRETLTEGDSKASIQPLWLEGKATSDTGRILVSSDAAEGGLLPGAVLHQTGGGLFAAPLLKMDKSAYLKKWQEALKQTALSNGKRIGITFMMYSQDYDGFLPPADGKISDMLGPYAGTPNPFQDPETGGIAFTHSYKDTTLSRYVNGNQIGILGYIMGPGGRAVIRADGSVLWEPSPAP